jgi:hypothetical protein
MATDLQSSVAQGNFRLRRCRKTLGAIWKFVIPDVS